jgi:lipoteichoic acid synthase
LAVHLSYFFIYRDFLHVNELYLFRETMDVFRHFSVPLNVKLVVLGMDLPFLVLLPRHPGRLREGLGRCSLFGRQPQLVTAGLLLALLYLGYRTHPSSVRQSNGLYDLSLIEHFGLVPHDVNDFFKSSEELKYVNQIAYGQKISAWKRIPRPRNVITIQVESLDANVIHEKFNGEYVAPYLHALADRCVYYPFMLSCHEAGGSSDSEIAVFNSFEPPKSYPFMTIEDYSYPNSLVKRLASASYTTWTFHGNKSNFYNRQFAFKRMGFSDFFDIDRMHLPEEGWGASDGRVCETVLQKLKSQRPPFYCHIITMSSHEPFENVDHY